MIWLLIYLSKIKRNPTVTELLIKDKKLNISLVSIMQPYFAAPKNIRLNFMYYFIMKIRNKQEPQQISAIHDLSDIEFQVLMNRYKKSSGKPYSILVIDTTLASGKPLRFGTNRSERI